MADVLKLVPKESGPEDGDLAAWLRRLADQVDSGEMPSKSAAIVFVVEEEDGFCCRMRRHGLHYLAVIGAFKTMTHDMLDAVS
jgi:hypothetical protein